MITLPKIPLDFFHKAVWKPFTLGLLVSLLFFATETAQAQQVIVMSITEKASTEGFIYYKDNDGEHLIPLHKVGSSSLLDPSATATLGFKENKQKIQEEIAKLVAKGYELEGNFESVGSGTLVFVKEKEEE